MKRKLNHILVPVAAVAAFVSISCSGKAQDTAYPETYVAVKLNGADLMSAPRSDAGSVAPAKMGEIYLITEAPEGGYMKVRNIATGAEGYLDTMIVNHPQYPVVAPMLADEEVFEPLLINRDVTDLGEFVAGWDFWPDSDGGVRVLENFVSVYNDGRARADQRYYKAEAKNGYLIVTESVEYGENEGTKLDTPIIIWQDIVDNAGVYIDGKLYAPDNSGGFDTDDWGD